MSSNLKAKDYLRIFFLYGIVYAAIPIIIAEIMWDIAFDGIGLSTLGFLSIKKFSKR